MTGDFALRRKRPTAPLPTAGMFERVVLGTIMMTGDPLGLEPAWFTLSELRELAALIVRMRAEGAPIEYAAIVERYYAERRARCPNEHPTAIPLVVELVDAAVPVAALPYYVARLRALAALRAGAIAGRELTAACVAQPDDPDTLIGAAVERVTDAFVALGACADQDARERAIAALLVAWDIDQPTMSRLWRAVETRRGKPATKK